MKPLLIVAVLASLMPLTSNAVGQPVWRCGADGRSFSDQPCKEGTSTESLRPRPAADVQAAAERVQRDATLAESMRQDRLQREAPQLAAKTSRPKKPTAAAKALRPKKLKRPEADGTFRATVPGSRRKSGLTGMQLTGHTCTHCGSSKWPTHSVHLFASIS